MSEQATPVLEDDVNPVERVEAPVKPLSVRDSLASAVETVKAKQQESEKIEDKAADKTPKIAKDQKDKQDQKVKAKLDLKVISKTDVQPVEKAELPPVKTPQSFQGTNASLWKGLDRATQEFLAKREEDYHRELTKQDEERQFGRSVKELAMPYLPLIQAEGGDITKGFQNYLNTAYILRTKSPQEKGQLLLRLAQEFGADLRGGMQQAQSPLNPQLQQLQNELSGLKGSIEKEKAQKKQEEDTALQSQVEAFRADPKNIHFEEVKADMAAMLRGGVAKDLQDAYDRAVYANPQTRSTVLQAQEEEKRLANEKKAKAEAAKRAGSSLKGGPGPSALKNGQIKQPDLRKALESAFAEHRGEA